MVISELTALSKTRRTALYTCMKMPPHGRKHKMNSTMKTRCYLVPDIANSCINFRPISPLVWYSCRKKFSGLKIPGKRANPQNTGLLFQVCLLCNPTGSVCNTRKNCSHMLTGKVATGMCFKNILYGIYEKMETIKEIIQKIISMNNFALNSTYKAKDCIVLTVPHYSEPGDKLWLKSCKDRIAYILAKNLTKRCSWGFSVFYQGPSVWIMHNFVSLLKRRKTPLGSVWQGVWEGWIFLKSSSSATPNTSQLTVLSLVSKKVHFLFGLLKHKPTEGFRKGSLLPWTAV